MGNIEGKLLSFEESRSRLGSLYYTIENNFKRITNNRDRGIITQIEFCDFMFECVPGIVYFIFK